MGEHTGALLSCPTKQQPQHLAVPKLRPEETTPSLSQTWYPTCPLIHTKNAWYSYSTDVNREQVSLEGHQGRLPVRTFF